MTEKTLAQQQAAGLRALADMIEQNPELAEELSFALQRLHAPLIDTTKHPRVMLAAFRDAATTAGAKVVVRNNITECRVEFTFSGEVGVLVNATAGVLAGVAEKPAYEPLGVS